MQFLPLLLLCLSCALVWCLEEDLDARLDCYLEIDFTVNEKSCLERNCVWDSQPRKQGIPICYLDSSRVGYSVANVMKKSDGVVADLQLKTTATKTLKALPQTESLVFESEYLTDRIVRFSIRDRKSQRYEVPIELAFVKQKTRETDEGKRKYELDVRTEQGFELIIKRKETGTKLIDTSLGGLVFSDQFLQLATRLPTKNIYGLGESSHQSLRHDLNYRTWPLFARDNKPGNHEHNLYGVHPFYVGLEDVSGRAHGVLFLNSNAQEHTLLPSPGISFKTTGGILDFFVFVGDNPEHVSQLYTSLVGRTVMPPFWALGYQLCRYGFQSAEAVKEVIDRNVAQKIPLDVMYVDIDYMDFFKDFTYDKNAFKQLPQLVNDSKRENGIRWTLILDPAIEGNNNASSYEAFADGYANDVFVKWHKNVTQQERNDPQNVPTDKRVQYGKVWPRGPASFPDFFKAATDFWWQKWVKELHKEVAFDALWIDMNEPSNFVSKCPKNKYDFPPIRTKAIWDLKNPQLSQQTICLDSVQGEREELLHYDVHSLYGLSESISTQKAVHSATGKRGFVVSRSTFVSSGKYASHWLGDNTALWPDIRQSIIGVLEFNFFGIDFVGADICGFSGETNPELCRRWSQLGAFYPFSRNHNEKGPKDQDPAVWVSRGAPEVTEAARSSLQLRYQLLHLLYTLFFRAHLNGNTVARPLFHEWPQDNETHAIDQQFLWGGDVLISPFLFQNQTELKAYLPPQELWYQIRPQLQLIQKTGRVTIPDSQPNGAPPVHLRGGSIIPMTSASNLTTTSSEAFNRLDLVVLPSKTKNASGELFWDDRESVDTIEKGLYNLYTFQLHPNCTLDLIVERNAFEGKPPLVERVSVVTPPLNSTTTATAEGKAVKASHVNGVLVLDVNLVLEKKTVGQKWTIAWSPCGL